MVKVIFLCWRRTALTHEEYVERLLDGHVPLALRHHPTLRRYVVNIVERSPAAAELDSIGALSFDTLEDFHARLYDSPAGQETIERDVRGFMGGAHAYATTEYVQPPGAAPVALGQRAEGVKLICPIQRRAGMSHGAFVDHWLHRHVPLALLHHPGMRRYVTNVVDRRLSETGEGWDGIAELHFGSAEDLKRRMYGSPADERIIQEDIARFIGRRLAYEVAEYVEKV